MNTGQTDEQLLDAANGAAFGELFDRHSRAVYLYVWGLAGNVRDAEDLTQDVFETAWMKLHAIRIVDASALPWLLVTARNRFRNADRRRAQRHTTELQDALIDPRSTDQQSESAEELQWVRLEIDRLGEIDRRICTLCLVEGHSYKEAARFVGLSTGAIAKRVERLRTHLRSTVRSES